jgi:hypothetical protein
MKVSTEDVFRQQSATEQNGVCYILNIIILSILRLHKGHLKNNKEEEDRSVSYMCLYIFVLIVSKS